MTVWVPRSLLSPVVVMNSLAMGIIVTNVYVHARCTAVRAALAAAAAALPAAAAAAGPAAAGQARCWRFVLPPASGALEPAAATGIYRLD
jgi:hypothetical protein